MVILGIACFMTGAIFGVGMMCVLQINRVNKGYYLESKMEKGVQNYEDELGQEK